MNIANSVIALVSLLIFSPESKAACGSNDIIVATSDQVSCLPPVVCRTLREVADRFGTVTIVSANRTPRSNRRRGGAKHSMHKKCRAVDFLVPNYQSRNTQQELANFLESKPGRYNVYCTGRAHFDNSNLRNGYSTCVRSSGHGKAIKRKRKRR